MAACAVLDKKVYVESTECKNITANTGRRRRTVLERKEIRSDQIIKKVEEGGWVLNMSSEGDRAFGWEYI